MTTINSKCGKYRVEITQANSDGTLMAVATSQNVGRGYGDFEYWFTIGHYKSEKTAIRQSVKKMQSMGRELAI